MESLDELRYFLLRHTQFGLLRDHPKADLWLFMLLLDLREGMPSSHSMDWYRRSSLGAYVSHVSRCTKASLIISGFSQSPSWSQEKTQQSLAVISIVCVTRSSPHSQVVLYFSWILIVTRCHTVLFLNFGWRPHCESYQGGTGDEINDFIHILICVGGSKCPRCWKSSRIICRSKSVKTGSKQEHQLSYTLIWNCTEVRLWVPLSSAFWFKTRMLVDVHQSNDRIEMNSGTSFPE